MLSNKRLQILITLMFVAMMFVQTPAIASNTAVLNTKSTDYQSGNQFSSGNTASVNSVSSTNTLNGNAQVSSVNENYIAYNQSGTTVEMNSSYVNPGQYLNVNVNTSLLNNFRYNNSLTYSIMSPIGQTPYNTSTYAMTNNTNPTQPLVVNNNWQGQSLQGSLTYNTSSYSQLYGVSINKNSITNNTYLVSGSNALTENITWTTIGYTTSKIRFSSTDPTLTISSAYTEKSINIFSTSHTLFLTNLGNDTTYHYRIYGVDIFGRTINSSIYSFTTPSLANQTPYIIGDIAVSVSSTYANVSWSNTNPVPYEYQLYRAQTRAAVGTSGGPVNSPAMSPLAQGTLYFFKLVLRNSTNNALSTTYDNGGQDYVFVTQQSVVNLSPTQTSYNSTSSQETVSFTTDIATNASIIYSTNPNFMNPQYTNFDNSSTSHAITFNVTSATNYYYMVNITTDGSTYYTIINSNSATSTTQTLLNPLSLTNPDYYTFQTPVDSSQDVHITHINLVFKLPTYPAVLGNWSVTFSVNQTNTISGLFTQNTNFDAIFPLQFILNDTLVYHGIKTFIQRGSITNGTGTYPIWLPNQNNGIYSPTDNLLFIGNISYSTAQNTAIDASLWNSYETTGLVNLYYNGKIVGTNKTAISSTGNLYNSISNPSGVKINASLISGLNSSVDNFINVAIPAKDIFGSVAVEIGINMPHGTSAPAYTQYSNNSLTLNVRYRLLVTKATGGHEYSLTQSNLVGSATVIPLQYRDVEQIYSSSNVTNFINLPGNAIHLNLSVELGGKQQDIFQFTNTNYTWYWYRDVIDSSLSIGNYTVSLLWTGLDGSSRSVVAENNTAYSNSPTPFSYTFKLSVSYTVQDLTANLTVLPSQNVTLRFKVVVPTTGVAWDKNLNITTDNNNNKQVVFDPVTGEYHLNVVAPSTPQVVTIKVQVAGVTLQNDTITYTVSKALTPVIHTGQPVITYSQVDKHVSLIGYGFIMIALVGTVVYAGAIVLLMRRR